MTKKRHWNELLQDYSSERTENELDIVAEETASWLQELQEFGAAPDIKIREPRRVRPAKRVHSLSTHLSKYW